MLPRECYLNQPGEIQVSEETNQFFKVEYIQSPDGSLAVQDKKFIWTDAGKPTIKEGIVIFMEGAEYPLKGHPSADTVFAANQIKAMFIEVVKTIGHWYFLFPILFIAFSKKKRNETIFSVVRMCYKILSPHYLKDRYLMKSTKTLHLFTFTFLYKLGIPESWCDSLATAVSHIINWDSAYRYRLADIFTELNPNNSPSKEVRRLLKIYNERELVPRIVDQTSKFAKLLSYALLIPKLKRAWECAILTVDLNDLKLDTGDKYWVCNDSRDDYNFMGLTLKERQELAKSRGWTYPEKMK